MSKKVKYLSNQNSIKLETTIQTDTRKTGNYREGSRRRKYRSSKENGIVDLLLKSNYTNKNEAEFVQRITILLTCRYKRATT